MGREVRRVAREVVDELLPDVALNAGANSVTACTVGDVDAVVSMHATSAKKQNRIEGQGHLDVTMERTGQDGFRVVCGVEVLDEGANRASQRWDRRPSHHEAWTCIR